MVTKSKLKLAIAAEKGMDFKKLKEKRKHKESMKRKSGGVQPALSNSGDENGTEHDSEEEEANEHTMGDSINLDAVNESDTSDSSIDFEEKISTRTKQKSGNSIQEASVVLNDDVVEDGEEEEEEDDEDIPVSDLEDLEEGDKEDLIPHTKLTINNTSALLAALKRISIPTDNSAPFASHQTVTSTAETASSIPDISDDLHRELAFYSQSLDAVRSARSKLRAEGVPFSRPKDYFAEMVKEDAHMEKVKAKLVEEAASKKAAAEARKLRDLKKFGKQVQVAKLQERQKAKRETLEKIKTLKRKRQETGGEMSTNEADIFDVGIDSELAKGSQRSGAGRGQMGSNNVNHKRQKRNEKYGFGGKKRHAKSGDAMSSGDLSGFDAKKMKAGARGRVGKAPRPGKNKRKTIASR